MEFHRDIIDELLMRLPVKALTRFKCVSKVWNDLISGGSFRKRYHIRQKYYENNAPTGFICHSATFGPPSMDFFFSNENKTHQFIYTSENYVEKEELINSLNQLENLGFVIASSNGLLLLRKSRTLVYVYDLVSKKHVKLQINIDSLDCPTSYGFKCDEKGDEICFKLVCVLVPLYTRRMSCYDVIVYSSQTRTWRKSIMKSESTFDISELYTAKVIGGVFHWDDPVRDLIVAYDSEHPEGRTVLIKTPVYIERENILQKVYEYKLRVFQGTKGGSLQLIILKDMKIYVWDLISKGNGQSYMEEEDIIDVCRWSLARSIRIWDINRGVNFFHEPDRIIGIDDANTDIVYMKITGCVYAYNHHHGKVVLELNQKTIPDISAYTHFDWPTWPCLLQNESHPHHVAAKIPQAKYWI